MATLLPLDPAGDATIDPLPQRLTSSPCSTPLGSPKLMSLVMTGAAPWPGVRLGGIRSRIASLTVLSIPHPAAFFTALRTSKQGLLSWYMALFQLPALPERVVARTLAKSLRDSGLPEEFVDQYSAAMSDPGALTGALNWYRGIPFSLRNHRLARSTSLRP